MRREAHLLQHTYTHTHKYERTHIHAYIRARIHTLFHTHIDTHTHHKHVKFALACQYMYNMIGNLFLHICTYLVELKNKRDVYELACLHIHTYILECALKSAHMLETRAHNFLLVGCLKIYFVGSASRINFRIYFVLYASKYILLYVSYYLANLFEDSVILVMFKRGIFSASLSNFTNFTFQS